MIKVIVFKNRNGIYQGFHCLGHAGYAEYGQDIVCSAVSVLTINTINSIEAFTDAFLKVESDDDKGLIDCLIDNADEKSNLLMDSMVLGLQGIQNNYKDEYIKIVFKEV